MINIANTESPLAVLSNEFRFSILLRDTLFKVQENTEMVWLYNVANLES